MRDGRDTALWIVGVDHKTCPVEVRERLALSSEQTVFGLNTLQNNVSISEVALLSTCARTEIYMVGQKEAPEVARDFFRSIDDASERYVWKRKDEDAVGHTFRVVAGLESQIVGESEIAGQVRSAVQTARNAGTLGAHLDALFRSAIACFRRLRTETDLGSVDASVAGSASAIYRTIGTTSDARVLIIGSGRIARMLAHEFQDGASLTVAARSIDSAARIAKPLGGEVLPLAEATQQLEHFDVVCSAIRSSQPILTYSHVKGVNCLVMFDVSLPRSISPDVSLNPGVTLFDVDAITPSLKDRSQGASLVESILEAEVRDFLASESIREVGAIIAALRNHVDSVRQSELERLRSQLEGMDPVQRATVETLTQRLIDRMFHHLVIRLRLAALSDPALISAADFFFAHGDGGLFSEETPALEATEAYRP